ncbi:MAG: thioredoxin family protein [Gemmataceae bacterium]
MRFWFLPGLFLITLPGVGIPQASQDKQDWATILRAEKLELAEPLPQVEWRTDLDAAMKLAKEQNRPLFVTMRCLPCKQCADFDKSILTGGPKLDPWLKQFVTVRVTDAQKIDFRLFPTDYQDYDLSWWGYFLSPRGELYAIFGGKDHVSAKTRISVPALINTMKRVLAHHYDSRRKQWKIDGPVPDLGGPIQNVTTAKGFPSWKTKHLLEKQSCIHCHQVGEVLRQPAIDAKTFDKKRDLQMWPLPENVGIVLDRDHGLKVRKVIAESPAAKLGIEAGDVLAVAGKKKLFGQADFRGVLHRGPLGDGTITVMWKNNGQLKSGKLKVEDGWRKTVIWWRTTVSGGNIGASPGFFPLRLPEAQRRRLKIPKGKMAVRPYMGNVRGIARKAGLQQSHAVVAVNGKSPDVVGREFTTWFRLQFDRGDTVRFTILERNGKKRDISYELTGGWK